MDHYSLESNLKFRRGASRYSHLFRAAIGHIISYCPWKSQIACFCLVLPVSSRSWCGHLAQVILVACHEASTSLRGCSWQLGFVWLCTFFFGHLVYIVDIVDMFWRSVLQPFYADHMLTTCSTCNLWNSSAGDDLFQVSGDRTIFSQPFIFTDWWSKMM